MKKVSGTLEFNAQMISRLCMQHEVSSCAVVTSLKYTPSVFEFCETLRDELTSSGRKTMLIRASEAGNAFEKSCGDNELLLVFSPRPDCSMDSFRACSECDAVIIVERYGLTRHKTFDEMTEFLQEQKVKILGAIGLTN